MLGLYKPVVAAVDVCIISRIVSTYDAAITLLWPAAAGASSVTEVKSSVESNYCARPLLSCVINSHRQHDTFIVIVEGRCRYIQWQDFCPPPDALLSPRTSEIK